MLHRRATPSSSASTSDRRARHASVEAACQVVWKRSFPVAAANWSMEQVRITTWRSAPTCAAATPAATIFGWKCLSAAFTVSRVLIRDAEDRDWPLIHPFFEQI